MLEAIARIERDAARGREASLLGMREAPRRARGAYPRIPLTLSSPRSRIWPVLCLFRPKESTKARRDRG